MTGKLTSSGNENVVAVNGAVSAPRRRPASTWSAVTPLLNPFVVYPVTPGTLTVMPEPSTFGNSFTLTATIISR